MKRGKRDHRHWDDVDEPYAFVSLDRLLADFDTDVATLPGEESKNG